MKPQPHARMGELKNMLPATLLVRFSAIALDLCVVATVCTLAFALMSITTPADVPAAQMPILLILLAAGVYIGWGRNRFASVGRALFKLQVARVAGPGGLPGRMVTVQADAQPLNGGRALGIAIGVMTCCATIATLALTQVLGSTTVFATVTLHAQSSPPFAQQHRAPPVLASLPNALLIGEQRAYVQIAVNWADKAGLLDYYLLRREGRWQVQAVEHAREPLFARYTLKTRDEDIPKATPKPGDADTSKATLNRAGDDIPRAPR